MRRRLRCCVPSRWRSAPWGATVASATRARRDAVRIRTQPAAGMAKQPATFRRGAAFLPDSGWAVRGDQPGR